MMDSYSLMLERIRVPQPSMQRFAVISIFKRLQYAPPHLNADSDPGRDAISQCVNSTSAAVVDQSIRELCRLVKEGSMDVSRGLLELQSALEGCDASFVDVFIKGIGFLVRFGFHNNDLSWRFDSPETHPFVMALSCRTEVQTELVQQVLLFMVQYKHTGIVRVCKFLTPLFNFSVLRIPFSISSLSFVRHLVSSVASLSCSFPSEAFSIIKLLTGCLKFFPRKNAEVLQVLIHNAEYIVDAYTVILRHVVSIGTLILEAQLCGVELLETLLSLCGNLQKQSGGRVSLFELSRRLLLVQKELGLQYVTPFCSAIQSLFLNLIQAELEHEQLSILKLSVFLLKWKSENDYISSEAVHSLREELLFVFPAISLMSSPSTCVKVAATDLLLILEKLLVNLLFATKKGASLEGRFPYTISKPELILHRLLQHLWFQDQPFLSNHSYLRFTSPWESKSKEIDSGQKFWISQLKEFLVWSFEREKSLPISPFQENFLNEMPLLLCSGVAVLVMHPSLGSMAVDSLSTIGRMDPKMGILLLLLVVFYNKIFSGKESGFHLILLKLLEMLPSLASHSVMTPLVVQTLSPMLHKDAKPVLKATAIRLLCKTWEMTDRAFGSLQGLLHPEGFSEFLSEKIICISMAASVRDVCRKNPDRGVDIILAVSACIESRDSTVQALGFESLAHLCEDDVVDFYTAWDVIAKHTLDYSVDPVVAQGICILLRWGAMDAGAYLEASRSVLQILWEVGTSRHPDNESIWVKARVSAFEALSHYEIDHIHQSIPDFKKGSIALLISEGNSDILEVLERFEVKIIAYEHTTRRRLVKEKRITGNKIEKLLDVFPHVIFSSGKIRNARELPGAALLCFSFPFKDACIQGGSKGLSELLAAYENALIEIAESLPLSRNILIALLSLQSWKPFMQRWMSSLITFLDDKRPSTLLEKTSKATNDILKSLIRVAEDSLPRSAENIALAVGALCKVLPPSAHSISLAASKFLLNWLFQYEHEFRQWSAAIAVGLISDCLHATDQKQKFQIITGLIEVACNSKSTLVKGACGVGLGFTCQNLLTRAEAVDNSNLEEESSRIREAKLLGNIVRVISLLLSQLSACSSDSLQSLHKYLPPITDAMDTDTTSKMSCNDCDILDEDVWGVAGLILGLGSCVSAVYRAGSDDVVLNIKTLLISWIPHANFLGQNTCDFSREIPLIVGSCLAVPAMVSFCQKVELIVDSELDNLVNGYRELIYDLISIKKSGTFHQCLLMASCVGAGNLLSCILAEGVHSLKIEVVKDILELFKVIYTNPYPPVIHLGGMLGVVNTLGAGAGTLTPVVYPQPLSLQTGSEQMGSSYIRGPLLSSNICETLLISFIQEIFLVAQDSGNRQLQRDAAWAVSFLRNHLLSKKVRTFNSSSQGDIIDSKPSFQEDSVVWKLCSWLSDLNYYGASTIPHVNTVASVLRCLSQAPRLPTLDWGSIIRRCMRFEAQCREKLLPDSAFMEGSIKEECIKFSLVHANNVEALLFLLDELSDLPRFRKLELDLQSCLLYHLADLVKIFAVSRVEKLFDDMTYYLGSSDSLYQLYDPDKKSLLRISFWEGLYQCLQVTPSDSAECISKMERCMKLLFSLLPELNSNASRKMDQVNTVKEWSEAARCLGKARQDWLMNLLEVSEGALEQGGGCFVEIVKRIQMRARLVVTGSMPLTELGRLKPYILNTASNVIWDVLIEVVAALHCAEGSVKRKWLVDAVEVSCITKFPTTALQFIGLLCGSCCKYMPLLIVDRVTVLSDLPVTLTSLLSDRGWEYLSETVVLNLWTLTERIYDWATHLESSGDDASSLHSIDESEKGMADFLTCIMYHICVSLKDHLPLEKQMRLANMVVPRM